MSVLLNDAVTQLVESMAGAGVRTVRIEMELSENGNGTHDSALPDARFLPMGGEMDEAALPAVKEQGQEEEVEVPEGALLMGAAPQAALPPIHQCPSPNRFNGRRGHRPEAIVIHIAEGSFQALCNHFRNPASQVSAHYGISQQGEIAQYVAERDGAWHAGNVDRPTWSLLKAGVNPNLYTIGIEHAGFADDPWTDAMYRSSAALIADICARWAIPLDHHHIIGHREIFRIKTCPGSQVELDKLIHLARGGTPPTPGGGATDGQLFHTVMRGDTLFGIAALHSTTLAKLKRLNPDIADINRIFVGQRVRVR